MKKIQRISYKSDSNTNEPRDNFIIITHGIRNVQIHINCIGNYNCMSVCLSQVGVLLKRLYV